MIQVTPIPQDKITECQPWRAWLSNIYAFLNNGVSGTFTTADVPPKTVTVTKGIITSIK